MKKNILSPTLFYRKNKMNNNSIKENLKTLFFALIIALIIRSLFLQPFYIPSSSMEPTLLVGDRLFVTKYSYGYSKHSFPFSPPIFKGLPGDKIQFIDGDLYLNNNQILKSRISKSDIIYCGKQTINVNTFEEKLPNGKIHNTVYLKDYSFQNSDAFIVPTKHYFFLGDNRDCSKDSRYLGSVGYVHEDNLVGKARFIFFSSDFRIGSIFAFWKWHKTIRINRFFKKII